MSAEGRGRALLLGSGGVGIDVCFRAGVGGRARAYGRHEDEKRLLDLATNATRRRGSRERRVLDGPDRGRSRAGRVRDVSILNCVINISPTSCRDRPRRFASAPGDESAVQRSRGRDGLTPAYRARRGATSAASRRSRSRDSSTRPASDAGFERDQRDVHPPGRRRQHGAIVKKFAPSARSRAIANQRLRPDGPLACAPVGDGRLPLRARERAEGGEADMTARTCRVRIRCTRWTRLVATADWRARVRRRRHVDAKRRAGRRSPWGERGVGHLLEC